MPVTAGAIRKLRADQRKAEVNVKIRKALREAVWGMRKKPSEKNLRKVFAMADRATKKKVIHANKAARLKSRLTGLLVNKKRSS
jgi:ribosomal protein S20